jgi:hypothetical protein
MTLHHVSAFRWIWLPFLDIRNPKIVITWTCAWCYLYNMYVSRKKRTNLFQWTQTWSPCQASPPNLPAGSFYSGSFFFFFFFFFGEEFCSDFLHICQLGEQDENGIVRSNIDFLICSKSIVLWPNLGKMTTKFRFRPTPPWQLGRMVMQFSVMIEDMM